mgnify:CR=1 FL=1|tara:strand:+ start:6937 stop:7590 length:654 start_codon:yes stop_codon:yes gene_type:complete
METELVPIKPFELMLDGNLTKANFSNFIGVWDNFMPKAQCDKFIEWYHTLFDGTAHIVNSEIEETPGDGRFQFPKGQLGRNDKQILVNHHNQDLTNCAYQYLQSCIQHYIWKYTQLSTQNIMSTHIKFQHTPTDGGYHEFHYEAMGLDHSARVLVWMIYLNDEFEGGETEFINPPRRIQPTTGTVLIWPAGFTHTHKGNLVLSGDKYVLTGWYYLNG